MRVIIVKGSIVSIKKILLLLVIIRDLRRFIILNDCNSYIYFCFTADFILVRFSKQILHTIQKKLAEMIKYNM